MTWVIFHRWHVLMQEQEVQTVCLLSVILLHCPMSATKDTAMLIKREVSDGVIALVIAKKHWRFWHRRKKEITM